MSVVETGVSVVVGGDSVVETVTAVPSVGVALVVLSAIGYLSGMTVDGMARTVDSRGSVTVRGCASYSWVNRSL